MFYRSVLAKVERPEDSERGPRARREREIDALRHRILDAAEEILVGEGYAGLSMRKLAEAVEYAPSTLYGYFPDKQSILAAVIERTSGLLIEALDDAAATPGPLTRLRMLGRAYLEFAFQYPRQYEVLFLLKGPTVPVIESEAFTAAVERFREAVSEGVRKGVFRRSNPDETAQAFWAACHGLAALLLTHHDRYDFAATDKLVEAMLTLQLEGLRPQAFGLATPVEQEVVDAPPEPAVKPVQSALSSGSIAASLARQAGMRTRSYADPR